jgi:hypothetical protein
MKKLLSLFFIVVVSIFSFSSDFNRYFENKTLIIDLIHSGNAKSENYSIKDFRQSDFWAGPLKNTIDDMGLGKYRVEVYDKESNNLIFSATYSSLFSEWQTVEESRRLYKSFEETVRIPFPKKAVKLNIFSRDKKGKFQQVFSFRFNHRKDIVCREKPINYEIIKFGKLKKCNKAVDILIVGEGYLKKDKEKFKKDFYRFSKEFFTINPYKRNMDKINIRGLFIPSEEREPDDPERSIYHRTIFDTMFYTFKLHRYLNTFSIHKLHFYASAAPYDTIMIMVNTKRYGGAGIYNYYSIFPTDNKFSKYVFLHEFGHNFGGLGDEYYSSKVTYSDFYPKGVEPWEPNITALLNNKIKWQKFISKDIPIPTPDIKKYRDKVGVFEGAGYIAKGLFRPTSNCIMYNRNAGRFCPVCIDAIEKRIDFYSDEKYK